jgi:hypothetical protein
VDGGVCAAKKGSMAQCSADVQCLSSYLCQFDQCAPKVLTLRSSGCTDRQTCPVGTICVGDTSLALGACQAPLMPGAECLSSDDCKVPLACVPSDGGFACAPRQPSKGKCRMDRDCQLLQFCKSGICTRLPSTGESCATERECLNGPCLALVDGGATCAEKLGAGLRCTRDDDCASGRCVSGQCSARVRSVKAFVLVSYGSTSGSSRMGRFVASGRSQCHHSMAFFTKPAASIAAFRVSRFFFD